MDGEGSAAPSCNCQIHELLSDFVSCFVQGYIKTAGSESAVHVNFIEFYMMQREQVSLAYFLWDTFQSFVCSHSWIYFLRDINDTFISILLGQ
jgi:hypothetical protein